MEGASNLASRWVSLANNNRAAVQLLPYRESKIFYLYFSVTGRNSRLVSPNTANRERWFEVPVTRLVMVFAELATPALV